MSDDEKYIRENIKTWVWSGFYDEDIVGEMLQDILEDGVEEDAMRTVIAQEFETKQAAEANWPGETDCDRLDRAFEAMNGAGICALQNAGYTMSDGHGDIAEVLDEEGIENFHGYCFYHGQDLERAVAGQGLTFAFGDLKDDRAAKTAVGHKIVAILKGAGFEPVWSGDPEKRIDMPIDWKRRYSD